MRFVFFPADNFYVPFNKLCLKLSRSEGLPVLPLAVLNLLKLFGNESVSSRELAKAIEEDAGLATKILKVASSPVFGAGPCENTTRAIGIIGINRMKQIAVTLGYEQFTQEKTLSPAFDKAFFMNHCKVTSSVAREIMAKVNSSKQDNAYMAGLIHDVGFLAMERYASIDFNQAILIARNRKIGIVEAAEQVCGFSHQQVSEELSRRWKLAPYIQDVIEFQNSPQDAKVDPETCKVVALAITIAYEMGYPPIRGIEATHASDEFLPLIDFTNEQMAAVVERAKIEMGDSKVSELDRRAA